MRGTNPIRAPLAHDGGELEVKHIFPTLQGEGPYAGWPAVFVRLGGCNLACEFCDTQFEQFTPMKTGNIVAEVRELKGSAALVVITGGEPLRQNIAPLCNALLAEGFKIQIETNGTLYRELPPQVSIVCSPKNTGLGYMPVRDDLMSRISALKFIVSASDPRYNHVSEVGQARYRTPVYVQPMDEYDEAKNRANRTLAMELAHRYGYRLSLQLHKILGIE